MTLPVLICDDSALARKQMARALPSNWDIELSFASNGEEALQAIQEGKAHLMFLDLNMPVMNGYEVLEQIRRQDLQTMVLVVSGDVQPEAYGRVMSKGALDFISKPVTAFQIKEILTRYGIFEPADRTITGNVPDREELPAPAFLESLREVINVAMGQAGSHLSVLLGSFIHLPVPEVFVCAYKDVAKNLSYAQDEHNAAIALSGVSHGFSGNGVAGEGILLLNDEHITRLRALMQRDLPNQLTNDNSTVTGILSDLSELLVGSCLKGISQQLDIEFNHSYPALLGTQQELARLLDSVGQDEPVLTISISYHLSDPDIDCYLILLFTEDSIPGLQSRVELLSSGSQELSS
ncbi:MAG: response regulator [Pseudohongiella sp.]|nr:response regulator [Pseudohongiella sp.]MDO9519492.1 response regulator [Pseudohongiella sp.]MDP2127500.1 response regulator [Pseudohongiella sp.]